MRMTAPPEPWRENSKSASATNPQSNTAAVPSTTDRRVTDLDNGVAGGAGRFARVAAIQPELGRAAETEDVLSIIGLMTRARNAVLMLLCLLVAGTAWAQGKGKIAGKILDDAGKPAPGVVVRAVKAGESTPTEAKTNEKGEWSMN